ncbi:uncharacterized protein TNCV_2999121 [Trichonephila clavipes]|nr:uncharacterized protein TNCV_2999121 [Trichonephila clavipes]
MEVRLYCILSLSSLHLRHWVDRNTLKKLKVARALEKSAHPWCKVLIAEETVIHVICRLFQNSIEADVASCPDELQVEVIELQTNDFLRDKSEEGLVDFYQFLLKEDFPNVKTFTSSAQDTFGMSQNGTLSLPELSSEKAGNEFM